MADTPPALPSRAQAARDAAILLARIRATGTAPLPEAADVLGAAALAADRIDRQLIHLVRATGAQRRDRIALGWIEGAAPDPDRHPSAPPLKLSPISYLVFALCLAAAWPSATADPFPGLPFPRSDILQAAVQMGAARNNVVTALDTTLPAAGLIELRARHMMTLGPAAAALPPDTWAEIRRIHEFLPHDQYASAASGGDPPDPGSHAAGPWKITSPSSHPATPTRVCVCSIVAALESSTTPVARKELPQLDDPVIKTAVCEALAACGRALIAVPGGAWSSGYADGVADTLAREGLGTLDTVERAVLALILLRTVAIPRARGAHRSDSWATSQTSTSFEEIATTRGLARSAVTDAIRELRRKGYVGTKASGGYIPGPAFARISAEHQAMLWEDLIVLARPNGLMAERIRERRIHHYAHDTDMPAHTTPWESGP